MSTIEKRKTARRKLPIRGWLAAGSLLLSGLPLLFLGCSQSESSISGTVRLDGQPLPEGWIRFIPHEGTSGPDGGAPIRQGKYSIPKGLVVGRYKIEIQGMRMIPGKKSRDPLFGGLVDAEEAIKFAEFKNQIRAVGPGHNTYDFDLEEAKKRQ
jgi:hypothetical protein